MYHNASYIHDIPHIIYIKYTQNMCISIHTYIHQKHWIRNNCMSAKYNMHINQNAQCIRCHYSKWLTQLFNSLSSVCFSIVFASILLTWKFTLKYPLKAETCWWYTFSCTQILVFLSTCQQWRVDDRLSCYSIYTKVQHHILELNCK